MIPIFNIDSDKIFESQINYKQINQQLTMLFLSLICILIMSAYSLSSINGQLSFSLTSTTIQQTTDYTIALLLVLNDPLTVGSLIEITFPSDYQSTSTSTYPCQIIDWPFLGASLTCSITNRILKVQGGFPQQYEITADTIFEFVVRDIVNPMFAGVTGSFSGQIKQANESLIVPIDEKTITIIPGSLGIDMEVSPAIVNSNADLIVSITPSHQIPLNGWLRIRIQSNQWPQSALISPTQIFESPPNCNFLNVSFNLSQNTPTNLYCNFSSSATWRIISIYNIVQAPSSSSFSFTISSIGSPPTTQPQGSFSLVTYTNESKEIDDSQNNKVYGLQAATILNPSIVLSTYVNSEVAEATISIKITSILQTADIFYIDVPSSISLTEMSKITVGSTQIIGFQIINSTILAFSGIQVLDPIQFQVILTNLVNPTYVTNTSYFHIWTKRNNYQIDKVNNAFSYSTVSGDLNATLTPSNYEAGLSTTYTFAIETQHSLTASNIIEISFPSDSFNILLAQTITCNSNLSSTCTLTITGNNVIQISDMVTNSANIILLSLTKIQNPTNVGEFTSVSIQTKTSTGFTVDSQELQITFSVEARQLSISDIAITSSSLVVYRATDLTLSISTNNPIPTSSTLFITIPNQLSLTGLSCSPYCNPQGSNIYSVTLSGSDTNTTLQVVLRNVRNPTSTKPTDSFSIQIYDSNSNLLEYIRNGLSYEASSPATLGLSIERNSTKNSQRFTTYTIQVGISFEITTNVALQIVIPSGIQCSGCVISDQNSTHYTILEQPLLFASKVLTATLYKLINYPSFEEQTIQVKVLASDLIYYHGTGTLAITNDESSLMTYSHEFTIRQYEESTTFTVSDISATTKTSLLKLQFIFGPQFDLTSASLVSNPDYIAAISGSRITLTIQTTSLSSFSVSGIICPTTSPSTNIYLSSYSDTDYLMDEAATITWTTLCDDYCKSCSSDTSFCLTCYDNQLLVISRVLLYNNTCVSICPDLYYHNSSTNSCVLCSTDCQNCLNYSVCTSCPTSKPYLFNNECYLQCPIGYFESITTCQACDPLRNCEECTDYLTCDTCADNYFFYLSQCYSSCPYNITVENTFSKNCDSCPTNCTKCTSDGCTQCQNGFLLDDWSCDVECQTVGYVPYNQVCRECDSTCLSCSQNIYNCLTCLPNSTHKYYLLNKCLQTCPNGYYEDNFLLLCLPCTQPCQYCSSSSVSSCESCIDGYSLFGSVCQSVCPQTFYQNGSECKPCASPCLTCSSQQICLTCQSNYSLFVARCILQCSDSYVSMNQVCIECSSNCKTCELVNYCSSCFDGTYLFEGTCISPCPQAYYKNQSILVCSPCPFQCSTCSTFEYCISCIGGYQLSPNNTCISTCDEGYVPIDSICQLCSQNCTSCVYITTNCTSCTTGFYFDVANNRCYQNCPNSFVSYDVSMECLTSCPSQTYENAKSCIDCPNFCSACISSAICSSCLSGASMYSRLCYQNCPSAAPYSINSECKSCNVVSCYECNGQQCSQCESGFLLIGYSLCIDGCGEQETYNTASRECEAIPDTNNNSTTTTPTETIDLDFIPLPYAIIGIICTTIVIVVHFTHKILILPILLGLSSSLLFLSALTLFIVEYTLYTTIRDGTYILLGALGVSIFLNIILIIIFIRNIEEKKWICFLALILGFKNLAFLCANIKGINFRKKYEAFWEIFDKMVIACIFTSLALITAGVLYSFHYKLSVFPFYGGIELLVLGIMDLLTTIFWLIWDHEAEQLPLEKIFQPQDSMDNIDRNEIDEKVAHSQIINPSIQGFEKEYKSDMARGKDVVRLKNSQIQQAIDRGVYRHNQMSLAKNQQKEDQLSQLESADKFNQIQFKMQMDKEENQMRKPKNASSQQQQISIEEKDMQEVDIIFEDIEENIDTQLQQNSDDMHERKKSIDSLGSEKKKDQRKVVVITPNKELVVEDFEDEFEDKAQEKNYINIFENEDEQKFKRKPVRKLQKKEKERRPPTQDISNIIYADLQSVGTVQEIDEEQSEWSDANINNREIPENVEDLEKPSNFMKTTFKYKNEQVKKKKKN